MLFFRKKTIFHAEEALPDPEELKFRFRRRVLLLTFAGFVAVLAIPVAKDLHPALSARNGTRRFAETLLEARTLASSARVPVSLELVGDGETWQRSFHLPGESCGAPDASPVEKWESGVKWKLQARQRTGETFSGRSLCFHPAYGLMLDSTPIGQEGNLLVTAFGENESEQTQELAYLLVGEFGAEVQMLSERNP